MWSLYSVALPSPAPSAHMSRQCRRIYCSREQPDPFIRIQNMTPSLRHKETAPLGYASPENGKHLGLFTNPERSKAFYFSLWAICEQVLVYCECVEGSAVARGAEANFTRAMKSSKPKKKKRRAALEGFSNVWLCVYPVKVRTCRSHTHARAHADGLTLRVCCRWIPARLGLLWSVFSLGLARVFAVWARGRDHRGAERCVAEIWAHMGGFWCSVSPLLSLCHCNATIQQHWGRPGETAPDTAFQGEFGSFYAQLPTEQAFFVHVYDFYPHCK